MKKLSMNQRTDLIRRFLEQGQIKKALTLLASLLPADKADVFADLSSDMQQQLLPGIGLEDTAEILEELDDDEARDVAQQVDSNVLAQVLDEMEPDEAADLLGDLSQDLRFRTLADMETREEVLPLLRYPDDSAGGLMTSDFNVFPESTPIGDVFRAIRAQMHHGEEIPYVYAVDNGKRLTGIAPLVSLIRTHPAQPLSAITETEFVSVNPLDDQEVVVQLVTRYDLLALPVIDPEGRLLGVITADDAMAAQQEEASEDIYKGAGIMSLGGQEAARSDLLVRGPIWRVWLVRVPFLVITLFGGMLAGGVIGAYEEALKNITVLAFFIPVVMGMGGNAGAQSDEIFIRAHALGQIDLRRFHTYLLKEVAVGLGMGVLLGIPTWLITTIWQGNPQLGLVVGLAMGATLSLSTFVGYVIPYILIRLGMDPTAGASPFITMIKDISGLFIYFTLASLILGHML
jgi:magnesium transporter